MKAQKIHIKELHLRVTGITRAEGRRLGERVAQELAKLSSVSSQAKEIPAIKLSVPSSGTTTVDGIARAIAQRIRNRLD